MEELIGKFIVGGKEMIHEKMVAIMAEIQPIAKDRKNLMQNFMFRGIDDLYNAVHGLMAKHGVYVIPEVAEWTREEIKTNKGGIMTVRVVKVAFLFTAADGSQVRIVTLGEAADSGDKATSKALSMALKYALMQVFLIPTEDMEDPDGSSVEPVAVDPKIMAVRKCQVPEELESYLAELAKNHQKGKAFDPELVKEIQKRKKELGVTKTFKEA